MHFFFPERESLEQKEGTGAQNLARQRGRCSRTGGPGGPRATRRTGLRRGPMAAPAARTWEWRCHGWGLNARWSLAGVLCPGHLTLNHNGRSRVPEGRPPAHLLTNNSSSRPCYWPGGAKLSYFGATAGGGQALHLSWRHQRVAQVGIWAGGVSKRLRMAAVWPEL